jgi:hypothetical protein
MSDEATHEGPRYPWLHWGAIMTGLYLVLLVTMTMPFLMAAFPQMREIRRMPWEFFLNVPYPLFLGLVLISQFLLIRVPVRLQVGRPVSRSGLWLPILATGFWMGCLLMGGILSGMEYFMTLEAEEDPGDYWLLWTGLPLLLWAVWAVVFWRWSGRMDPRSLMERQQKWMLRGSVLELLVAVPTHIVARGRTECCAGFLTFFGLTMGVTVMLLAFGPAVFVLFYARWRRLRG